MDTFSFDPNGANGSNGSHGLTGEAGGVKTKTRRKPTQSVLGTTITLEDFVAQASESPLTTPQRERIVDQALLLMEQVYVHLPLKRAMHAVDPVQRLKLLRRRLPGMTEEQFNREMLSIFTELRDLHTNFVLPEPYQDRTALLPFLIEEFFEDGKRRYMVSHVAAGFRHTWFKPGVIVTHWNGLPIERAVALNAEQQMGSNPDARNARSLESMTIRPLMLTPVPDEEWVTIRYLAKQDPHEAQFRWRVIEPSRAPGMIDPDNAQTRLAFGLGYDALTETARRVKKELFAPKALEAERRMSALDLGAAATDKAVARDLKKTSTMPDVFSFRTVETPDGTFGYIRIWTFMVNDEESFVNEFIRIAGLLPQNGLIIDVRANGGGLITAGEMLLQLLTPKTVEPERLHFINTPLTQLLCQYQEELAQWEPSIAQSVETGTAFSFGFPIMPPQAYNTVGQIYHGPVVLIVDALCYSTTDIFAAGFQDHNIGRILGTNGNMGAGGANVWTHDLLRYLLPPGRTTLKDLPRGSAFRVAVRRTTRVGERSGVPLEGLGVIPDERHYITANDLLNKNEDLIHHAGKLLAQMPAYELEAEVELGDEGVLKIEVTTGNISRLDVWVGGRPQTSVDVQDGTTTVTVNAPGRRTDVIELRGFQNNEPVACQRIGLDGF